MMAEANRTIDCKNLAPFAEKMAEEEETYVFVEFTGLPDDNLLKQYKGTCSLLKAENSTEVILQLDRYTFRGSLEDAAGTNLFFKKSKDEKMTYFCKGTKKVNLQRVILKRKRTEVATASSTTTAKQVKHDSSEMGGVSSGPANGLQQEDLAANDPAHSEQGVCEAVECEGEPVHSQNMPGEDACNTELTGPHYAPNVTESNSE